MVAVIYREVLSDRVLGEKGVRGDADEKDGGVMNYSDKSSTTCVTRTVLTNSSVVWERVDWRDFS